MDGSYPLDYKCICSAKNTLCIFPKVHWPNTENIARAKVRGSPAGSLPSSHRQLYFDAAQGIYKILKIIHFLHLRLPCAVCTLEVALASTREYTRYLLFAQCLISDAYVVETLCRSGQVSCWQGSRCAMSRPSWSDIVNTRLRWISLSLICFFYLLSVCFLSTSGQSLSEFLSIQGFARSPSQ